MCANGMCSAGRYRCYVLLHLMSCWAQGREQIWMVHLWKHMDTCSSMHKCNREMCFVYCDMDEKRSIGA